MAPRAKSSKRDIKSYVHAGKKRVNNPPVGLVTPETDKDAGTKTYAFDPHLDPTPQKCAAEIVAQGSSWRITNEHHHRDRNGFPPVRRLE
jgi:hypothetical protein